MPLKNYSNTSTDSGNKNTSTEIMFDLFRHTYLTLSLQQQKNL